MTTLPLSTFYISILSLLALLLAIQVVRIRMSAKIGIGDGDNEQMIRQIRVHANLLENLIPFSILFTLAELNNAPRILLHIIGLLFLVARILHASGLSKKSGMSKGRYRGTLFSWICILALIGFNLFKSLVYFID